MKLKSYLKKLQPRLGKDTRAKVKKLLEDDSIDDMTMEAPADVDDSTDPDDALWQGFRSAMMAVIDGDGSLEEKLAQLKDYLKTHAKLSASKGDEDDDDDDVDLDVEPNSKVTESVRAQAGRHRSAMSPEAFKNKIFKGVRR